MTYPHKAVIVRIHSEGALIWRCQCLSKLNLKNKINRKYAEWKKINRKFVVLAHTTPCIESAFCLLCSQWCLCKYIVHLYSMSKRRLLSSVYTAKCFQLIQFFHIKYQQIDKHYLHISYSLSHFHVTQCYREHVILI